MTRAETAREFNNAHGRNALFKPMWTATKMMPLAMTPCYSTRRASKTRPWGMTALDSNTTGIGNTAVGKEAGNDQSTALTTSLLVTMPERASYTAKEVRNRCAAAGPFADSHDTCFIGSIANRAHWGRRNTTFSVHRFKYQPGNPCLVSALQT